MSRIAPARALPPVRDMRETTPVSTPVTWSQLLGTAFSWYGLLELDAQSQVAPDSYHFVAISNPGQLMERFARDRLTELMLWYTASCGLSTAQPDMSQLQTSLSSWMSISGQEMLRSQALKKVREAEEQGALVSDVDAVQEYLTRHTEAQSIIQPVIDATRQLMGSTPQLSLEVYRDPEFGGEQLSLYVRSDDYTDDFLKRLQAAAREARLLRSGKDDNFLVTTDFQPPR